LLDRVVWFAARELRLSPADTDAVLVGKSEDGTPLEGRDALRTLAAILSAGPGSSAEEKLPPIEATVVVQPEPRALAVLGSPQLDPRTLVLGSIRVDGRPITKGTSGDVVAYRDANGDGAEDAVLWIPKPISDAPAHRFEGMTSKGRMVRSGEAPPASPSAGEAQSPAGKSVFPFSINILDVAPASPYPATIQVSGAPGKVSRVRVTLSHVFHTCLNDLDVMLVAPSGQSVVLMSDVGGCDGMASGVSLTFDDYAPGALSPGATPTGAFTGRPVNNTVGDPFAAPAPVPSGATSLSAFEGTDPNGAWKLYVVDDAGGDTGFISGWALDLVTSTQVCNTSPVTIPDSGAASLYPSAIMLAGLPTQIAKVSVTLQGFYHNNAEDLDVLLVDPGGTGVMLMSDISGPYPFSLWNLTFDDDAWEFFPEDGGLFVGAYRPTNHGNGPDTFPSPAPQIVAYPDLFRFRGRDPNGTWRLYVADDAAGGTGAITEGWCLNVTTIVPSESCHYFPMTIPDGAPNSTSGPAFPYPSTMSVAGTSGVVDRVQVRLLGLSHTYPDDLDVALQAPSGRAMVLMSDVGGGGDVSNLDVTLDTTGPTHVPDEGPLGPGPYFPTDAEGVDPLPAGGPASFTGSLQGEVPNGDWSLWVNDDAGADIGSMASGWCMSLTLAEGVDSYCSNTNAPLTIPAGAPGNTSGAGAPYPWTLFVQQEGRIARKVRVRIEGLSHTYPDDLDIMLVGPQNRQVVLMSDAGGSSGMVQQWITFDDEATLELPDDGGLFSNTYKPHNYGPSDPFPGVPYGIEYPELYGFQGTDPHGYWYLYVQDDASFDTGSAIRWCIDVFPLYPVGEPTHVRWYDKTVLWWDAAPNALGYRVLRGTQAELGALLTEAPEGCAEPFDDGSNAQVAVVQAVPPPESFFWYLVLATSGPNIPGHGPAGAARVDGLDTARVVEPAGGLCP
jgi:subtilisin-like proprotein convertase family protein